MQATDADRKKAYRLRDIVSRGRRELKKSEARWLADYDDKFPPRGRNKEKARPRGGDVPEAADVAPELKPQTISWVKGAASAPPPVEEQASEVQNALGVEPAPGPKEGPGESGTSSPAVDVSVNVAAPPPPAEPSFSNEMVAAVVAGFFVAEVQELAAIAGLPAVLEIEGHEIDWRPKLAEGYRAALAATLNKYFPAGAASEHTDLYVSLAGGGILVGGPMFRAYREKQKQKAASERPPGIPERPAPEAATVIEAEFTDKGSVSVAPGAY